MNSERILQQVQASLRPQAKAFLQEKQQTPELSLLLRALLFVGALCGAVLLISASSLHIFFTHSWPRGVIFLVAGWILLHRWRDDGSGRGLFLRQLGGLLALGGQILIGLELESWLRYKYLWLGITVLAGVSYPLFRSSFNRFFWCALAVSLCCYKLIDGGDLGVTACGLIGLGLFAAAAGIFIKRLFSFYPLAYALLWGCAWVSGVDAFSHAPACFNGVNWLLAVLAGVYLYKALAGHKKRGLGVAVGAVCALVLNWPSVLALAGMYLGRRLRENVLEWLALAGLVCGLVVFYFSLNISLTYKSLFLIGPGLLMLWARSAYAK